MEAAVGGHCRLSFSKHASLISLSTKPTKMTRRRFLRRSRSSLWICFDGLILLAACIVPSLLSVDAKEVVATKDWTLLGENDTVAAGMHIRMDLATGQKWVKLPSSPADDDDESGDHKDVKTTAGDSRVSSNQRQATATSSSSSAVAVSVNGESTTETANPGDESDDSEKAPYDYGMMHRTLSQLPDEERARIALPEAPPPGMTDEQRVLFEGRMKHIWLQRQEELRRFEQEFVADMPQILRDRIVRLQQYVNDPYQELLEMSINDGDQLSAEPDASDSSPVVTHIVSVLADLEYHLSDIDMTRDFYTLGGWPLLVSMLHDGTHHAPHANQTAAGATGHDPRPVSDAVHHVQAHAAWALGTAVKNTGEFAPFVVEPLVLLVPGQPAPTMSALQVLLDQLSNVDLVDASKPLQDKVHKYLYALGSFVRGNPLAQRQFVSLHGTRALEGLVDMHVSTVSKASSRKIVHRVVSILDDLILETSDPSRQQQQHPHDDVSGDLVRGISTPVWCESTSMLLATTLPTSPSAASILHSALRLAGATAPRCQRTDPDWSHRVRGSASNLLRHWQDESKGSEEAADLDELKEGIDLAQSVLAVLDSTTIR
jgi:nucleotide exchange factor SIL1